MADVKSIASVFTAQTRQAAFRWWGTIGCRLSFFMMTALLLAAALVGAFFFREGKKILDAEIRERAFYLARVVASLTAQDVIDENRPQLSQKIVTPFTANDDASSGKSLLYVVIYNKNCDLLIGRTDSQAYLSGESFHYRLPSGNQSLTDTVALTCEREPIDAPIFVHAKHGVYDLTLPIRAHHETVGFVRVGVSGQQYEERFSTIMKKVMAVLFSLLLVGMAFIRFLALGITKPIMRISEAADKLNHQNFYVPLFVKGSDEISKLGNAFNEMALALEQREKSLSRGNRDLFVLHMAGLDLMEGLERDTLLAKIAARAEDLVNVETTAISAVADPSHVIKYLGVFGGRAEAIKDEALPLESGGIYNWLTSYGTPLLIQNAEEDFRLDGRRMRSLGIKCMMTVPLWSSNTMTGLLTAINKKGGATFDNADLRLFTVFSNLASAALQNAALYSDLKENMEELKTTQEQLVHSAKMAAIGEISANVAHEINNPLTSVLGYTSHLRKMPEIPEAQRNILGMMEQETLRVRKIIRNLLDFARHRPSWMQPEDVSRPLRETVALVRGIADASSVIIHEEYPGEPLLANMDYNEIKQVFINIIHNALQAMPDGGRLHIRLGYDCRDEIVAEISDTGTGIAPEHVARIFEPFYTTKRNGDGTGLGLSISYRIMQNHGGRIETENLSPRGATFKVILPRYHKAGSVTISADREGAA